MSIGVLETGPYDRLRGGEETVLESWVPAFACSSPHLAANSAGVSALADDRAGPALGDPETLPEGTKRRRSGVEVSSEPAP
jgi:hypothetical protein